MGIFDEVVGKKLRGVYFSGYFRGKGLKGSVLKEGANNNLLILVILVYSPVASPAQRKPGLAFTRHSTPWHLLLACPYLLPALPNFFNISKLPF